MQAFDRVSTVTIAVATRMKHSRGTRRNLGSKRKWMCARPSFDGSRLLRRSRWMSSSCSPPGFLTASAKTPTWVLSTRDCQGGYEELKAKGVEFSQKPEPRPWGIEAIFTDLYGNQYHLCRNRRR